MISGFERFVAFRYLLPQRGEGFLLIISLLSLVGIMLGVAMLIITMAVMNGFRAELIDRVLGLNGHLGIYGFGEPLEDYDGLLADIRAADGVVTVSPVIEGQALISHRDRAVGAAVRGVVPEDFLARPAIAERLQMDLPGDFGGTDVIAIGSRMAARLNLRLGDSLTLISPIGNAGPFGTTPRLRAYDIAAIFEAGMHEYDSSFVYMSIEAAQIFFRMPEQVTALEVYVDDPDDLSPAHRTLQPIVAGQARIWDWQQSNASFFSALQVERNMVFMIVSVIVFVAAFNIISGLVILVRSKRPDIAILRTMGANRRSVMRIFVITGATIGVLGTLVGFLLGVAFVANIDAIQEFLSFISGTDLWNPEVRFLTQMPAKMEWPEVTAVVLMSLFLSFIATLYPAWSAARLDPVKALRSE